jgi:hypothetical protein
MLRLPRKNLWLDAARVFESMVKNACDKPALAEGLTNKGLECSFFFKS